MWYLWQLFWKQYQPFIKTNVHEGDKDFKCESCEKSFIQADSLRGHIKNIRKGHKYSHWD